MIEHEKYFQILNERLKEKNETLTLYTVGGFALKCYGLKTTMDIDAFYDTNDTIEKIIADIGDEYGINGENEHWINQAVAYLKDKRVKNPGKEFSELINKYSNLEVYRANIDFLLVMKTIAVSDNKADKLKHIDDARKIINTGKIQINNLDDYRNLIKKFGYEITDDIVKAMNEILDI